MMLEKELLGKVMYGEINFIGGCVDMSSRSISTEDFKGL